MARQQAPAAVPPEALLERLQVSLPETDVTLALTHRSYAYENGGLATNERLEFLGDSVLGIVVTDSLYHQFPEFSEGSLAKLRACVVNMRALAKVARAYNLGPHILLGRGETLTGGSDKDSILADTVEALIGAVYAEHGIDVATTFVHRLMDPIIQSATELGAGLDWKTSLQELTARRELGVPQYRIAEAGPDHAKRFTADVWVADQRWGSGEGTSKKVAEQLAAAQAFAALKADAAAVVKPVEGASIDA